MARASLPEEEKHVVQVVMISISSLSLFGCFYILLHQYRVFRDRQKMSMTHRMVLVLAILDFLYTGTKVFGRRAIGHPIACQLQGFMVLAAGNMIFLWTSAMAHSMYRWIVCRDSQTKLENRFKWYLIISIVPSVVLGIAFVIAGLIGDATFYCWVADPYYYPLALIVWLICALVYICTLLCVTQSHLAHRAQTQANADAQESLSMISFKLRTYMVAFVVLWLPSLIFRCMELFGQEPSFPLALIMQVTLSLQGLVNAVTYGGLLTSVWKTIHSKRAKSTEFYKSIMSPSLSRASELDVNTSDKQLFQDSVKIFVSTFNLGESKLTTNSMNDWIPRGYDVYVIGVQECLQLMELRARILHHIERNSASADSKPTRYTQFTREIGNCNTALGYHGHIAITVFVKTADVKAGAFFMPTTAQQEVNRGKSLVLARASNKGAVGFAFRYYDTSLAFVTCHLTSDCKGKSKAVRRNQDIAAILGQLNLNVDDVGFEFPLLHHHTFVFGDLNYRLALGNPSPSPQQILQLIKEAHDEELRLDASDNPSADWCYTEIDNSSREVNDSVLTVRERRRIWSKLVVHDELTYFLQSSQVLHGFEEAEICFPPTFRRIRGIHLPIDSSTNWSLDQVQQCFSTQVEGAGHRVPSYTDRILFSSQPDCRERLRCLSYTSCESVNVSDHKPVNGVFELAVDRCCKPLELYRQSAAYVQRVKDLAGVFDCCICLQHSSLEWWSATGETLIAHGAESGDLQRNQPFVGPDGKKLDARQVCVSVVFPLPCEDIFSEQRKLHEVADMVRDGMFPDTNYTNQALKNVTASTLWSEFVRQGIRHTSLTCPSSSRHIAIKLHTGSGKCFGQGIVSFSHEVDVPQGFRIDLSVGGSRVGSLSGVVSVRWSKSHCYRW